MKIKFDSVLVDLDDNPIIEGDAPISVKTLLVRSALADVTPQGQPIPADEKIKRFEIFLKLKTADSQTDFSLEEVALLDRAVLVYGTLIAGQLHYLLQQKS